MDRDETQEGARERTVFNLAGRRRIERSLPADEAEQGRPELFMAAAAKEDGGRNGTLGFLGGPGWPYKELDGSGWPWGSTCHGGEVL